MPFQKPGTHYPTRLKVTSVNVAVALGNFDLEHRPKISGMTEVNACQNELGQALQQQKVSGKTCNRIYTHLYSGNLSVHELIFRGGSLKPFPS